MKNSYKIILVSVVLVVITLVDQVTKSIARQTLAQSAPISLLGGVFRLEYHENSGAFLSLGAGLPVEVRFILFVVLTCLVVVGTLVFMFVVRDLGPAQLVGCSLLASGGVGNLIDRVFNNGYAIDFMWLGIGPLYTGIFNVADLAIVAGIAILLLSSISFKRKERQNPVC